MKRFFTLILTLALLLSCLPGFAARGESTLPEETINEPEIAKVTPKTKTVEVIETEPKAVEPKEQNISQVTARPRQPYKANRKANVSKSIAKEEEIPTPRPVEEGDIVPFEDPRMQFAEQARTLRERGNRVIQRVSMNGLPSNNYQLNDL